MVTSHFPILFDCSSLSISKKTDTDDNQGVKVFKQVRWPYNSNRQTMIVKLSIGWPSI